MSLRDPDKQYVVSAPYVTLTTMTAEGVRVMGFGPGAPVPQDVPAEQFDHHLQRGLITAVGEQPANTTGADPAQIARQAQAEVDSARRDLAAQQARLDAALAAKKAADADLAAVRATAAAKADQAASAAEGGAPGGEGGGESGGSTPEGGGESGDSGKEPAKAAARSRTAAGKPAKPGE